MPQPEIPPVESGIERLSSLEINSNGIESSIKGELSQPADIKAAHNYFSTNGHELNASQLPDLGFDSGLPAEFQSSPLDIGNSAASHLGTGMETGLGQAINPTGLEGGFMPGLEQGAIAGMPPGTEPISPMIQMILKMPGLTGTVASFFEAIMSFLFPADGGFLNLLDPTLFAQTAQQAFGSIVSLITEQIPLSISLMPNTSGIFDFFMQNNMQSGMFDSLTKTATNSVNNLSIGGLDAAPPDASNFFVNGSVSPGKPLFETAMPDGSEIAANSVNFNQGTDLLAFDNGNSFSPTIGGYSHSNISVDPNSVTTSPGTNVQQETLGMPQDATHSNLTDSNSTGQQAEQSTEFNTTTNRGDLLRNNAGSEELATNQAGQIPEAQPYTVQSGDNLWNIAKTHLGQGDRWQEIYQLNAQTIGANPNLIYSGSELQLPGSANISTAGDYVVQSGDNLWNIARDHIGSGSQWPSIYHGNTDVIGANPDLIHPGQHLAVPDAHGQGSVHMANSHHATSSHGGKIAQHHARHNTHTHSKHGSPSSHNKNLAQAQTQPQTSASQSIAKQETAQAATAQNELEKTALLPASQSPQPVGLRAVAKSL